MYLENFEKAKKSKKIWGFKKLNIKANNLDDKIQTIKSLKNCLDFIKSIWYNTLKNLEWLNLKVKA